MKKPIAILFTDPHLTSFNFDLQYSIYEQTNEIAKELKIKNFVGLGDFFESRKAQTIENFNNFEQLINLLNGEKYLIPGNHDKTDYFSEKSYLGSFRYHPKLNIFEEGGVIENFLGISKLNVYFLPYFDEKSDILQEKIKKLVDICKQKQGEINVLFTHLALEGVHNNKGALIGEDGVKISSLSLFSYIYVGHYHNREALQTSNISYIGAMYPHNFAENQHKGVAIFYDDGTISFRDLKFPIYKKIEINLKKVNFKEVQVLKEKYSNYKEGYVAFEFKGEEEHIRSIQKINFETVGIKVIKKFSTIEKESLKMDFLNFSLFNEEIIIQKFEKFCEKKKVVNKDFGKDIIDKILKIKN